MMQPGCILTKGARAQSRVSISAAPASRRCPCDISPALEGHIAKYRKLVPALALINHLADACEGPVSEEALVKALALTKYVESHARRVYSASGAG